MLKVLVGFALEVLVSMFSRKAVGLLAIFFWNTSCQVFEPSSPKLLALPLLWAVFDNVVNYLPREMTDRMQEAVR
jgi:hypothetical protein